MRGFRPQFSSWFHGPGAKLVFVSETRLSNHPRNSDASIDPKHQDPYCKDLYIRKLLSLRVPLSSTWIPSSEWEAKMDLKGHLHLFLQRSLFRKYLNYSVSASLRSGPNFGNPEPLHRIEGSRALGLGLQHSDMGLRFDLEPAALLGPRGTLESG